MGSVIQFLAATSSPGLTGDLKSALGSGGYRPPGTGPGNPDAAVAADLQGVVGHQSHEGCRDSPYRANASADIGIERAGVGDVPAHGRVANCEDEQDRRDDHVDEGYPPKACHGEADGHAAGDDRERRRRGNHKEDDARYSEGAALDRKNVGEGNG